MRHPIDSTAKDALTMNAPHRFTLIAGASLALSAATGLAQAAKPVKAPVAKAAAAPTASADAANAAAAAAAASAAAAVAREAALMQKLEQLSAEMAQLKAQVGELRQQAAAGAQAASNAAVAAAPAAINGGMNVGMNGLNGAEANGPAQAEPATVLTGYGEVNYNRYSKDKSKDSADMRRFVLGVQHRFDPQTKLVTELEIEHGVSSADDAGEVEVEQAYVERQLSNQWAMRAGLFLMPAGLLNENHEPTAYYGVERNFVETAIIPSTWREGGLQFVGNLDHGLTLQAGLSTGFDVSKWDSTDAESAESPLGATHQELSQAHSGDMAVFGALNWRGVPGLLLGASWFAGNGGQKQATAAGNGLRVTLWDLHARYMMAGWDLSALYARGTIGGTAEFNLRSLSSGPDWYPTPRAFDGAYVQAAYKLWSSSDLSLSPFVRVERYNTRKAYADLGAGVTPDAAPTDQVVTVGANLAVGQGVVFKADVQRFKGNARRIEQGLVSNRFDLGVGWSF
jgi:hypothetical protein